MKEINSKEMVMFYNVENLFLPDAKPIHYLDPTKSGLRNWDEKRYSNKIFKIAHVAELVKEEHSVTPFLVGLSEIQGKEVLEDLLKNEIFSGYDFVHYDSMDERGVDVALLYDSTKIQVISSEAIPFKFEIVNTDPDDFDTTRDVLHCKVLFQGKVLNIFVLHLPSKREKDINLPKREFITRDISNRISTIIKEKNEAVIVMGDFNSNPDEKVIENLTIDKEFDKILLNPYLNLYRNNIFSGFYYKDGLLFDQILLSQHFFNPNSSIEFKNAMVFSPEKISSWDRQFKGRPFRTYAGTRYLGGYSDHFPVITEFETRQTFEN